MSDSATIGREARRRETARRIQTHASRLTLEHGLDGWTMDDLARAAEVSRRTLFNHVPSKVDAVIGEMPEVPAEALTTFRAGGPSGDLLCDLSVLAHQILGAASLDLDLHTARLRRRLLTAEPRLLALVHGRFEDLCSAIADQVVAREGEAYGAARARLTVRLLASIFDSCIDQAVTDPSEGRTMPQLFDAAVDDARALFARPA